MRHEASKVSRIIDELNSYYLNKGARKINISIEELDDQYKIFFEVCCITCSEEELDELRELLNESRQPEVEAYYWTLTSEPSDVENSELSLIGMMVDKAEIAYEGSKLVLKLYRYK